MKSILYVIVQCTWGILQTMLGFAIFLMHYKEKHFFYHGAIITVWEPKSSMSLGLFVFVTAEPYFAKKYKGKISEEELFNRLLVHAIQSLILGPLSLIVIGIPSTLWGFLGSKKRRDEQIPYGAFFTEKWANHLGEQVTGKESIGNLVLD